MSTVIAQFHERKRIVFTARGRSTVNVRESSGPDGAPIGYTSTELLLISLGNCMLGWLMNGEILRDRPVRTAEVTLDADMASDPPRVARIRANVRLVVEDTDLLERRAEIAAAACGCPMCNTIGPTAPITVELDLTVAAGS